MDDLRRMMIFYHVIECKSFSGAARKLGIAKSAVSRHINLLEQQLGVRLVHRSTRSLNLTETGKIYYQSCANIVSEAETANRRVSQLQDQPVGTLKIAAPISLGNEYIAPLIVQFMKKYQEIKVEMMLGDQVEDMLSENIDVSIRVGWLQDSNLIAKKICESKRIVCASPDYLRRYGTPVTPEDLLQHEWIIFSLLPAPYHWCFHRDGKEQTIHVKGRIKTNNADLIRTLLLEGVGVMALSNFLIADDIKQGRLVPLLEDYTLDDPWIYAIYQDRQYQQTKLRLFVDFIRDKLASRINSLSA